VLTLGRYGLAEEGGGDIPLPPIIGDDRHGLLVVARQHTLGRPMPGGWKLTRSPILNSSISTWARICWRKRRRATMRLLRSMSSASLSWSMSIFIEVPFLRTGGHGRQYSQSPRLCHRAVQGAADANRRREPAP